ncbi:hypothetical protein [Shewanella sp. Isolate11]|uniref:hypothetical protein n=1 Tax=Shewanella sp. Isolate11 TaxID=2908530 RepID=UPI001EFD38E6|nr:hypothetical protein [Shewanella sp. Isolate11]MCG9697949.1 hypothetical protein [Shewanella sp. Isolate11]
MQTQFQLKQQRWLLTIVAEDYRASRSIAANCPHFVGDDEDEQVDDVTRSCVNCAYRRWLTDGIECTALAT